MPLQALALFYSRMAEESGTSVAPEGFEYRRIPCVVVLDREGQVVTLQDTRSGNKDNEHGSPFLVPKGVKKTSGVSANLLWDNPSYVLGHPKPGLAKHAKKRVVQAKERQRSFTERIRQRFPEPVQDAGIQAVLLFLERGDYRRIFTWEHWREVEQEGFNLTFALEGDDCLVCQRPAVIASLSTDPEGNPGVTELQTCLVTGDAVSPVRVHSAIKGVWGTLSAGANIVSFGRDAFCSFGLKQGRNAPIGKQGEFAYTTALNMLLASPKHRLQIGDTTTVFWGERRSVLEDIFAELFSEPPRENPDQVNAAIARLEEIVTGGMESGGADRTTFFLLALAPNVARIAIRLWYHGSVAETAHNIARHFGDCRIVNPGRLAEHPSLFRLLKSTATRGRAENIESQLACELMRSILSGSNYPQALLISLLRRCRAEGAVTHPRAALIKGILVRQGYNGNTRRQIGVELDTGNGETGYLLGRLFSLIERAQETAIEGIRSTISNYYFGTASSTPALVFPHLLKLKNQYLDRIRGKEQSILLEQLANVQGALNCHTAYLPLSGQALFALGYYHQRHALSSPDHDFSKGGFTCTNRFPTATTSCSSSML